MAKTYKKNGLGRMSWVYYERFGFWLIVSLMVAFSGLVLRWFVFELARLGLDLSGFVQKVYIGLIGIGVLSFSGLVVFRLKTISKELGNISRLFNYWLEKKAEKAVEEGLLSAGLVKKTISETVVKVPSCVISVADQRTTLKVEKLPSVADMDKVAEAVNSSLRFGKFADYAVSDPIQTADGLYYVFELVDVNRDLTFRPKDVLELVPENPYKIKLMEGVYWDFPSQPMALIAGQSGSFKTTTMRAMLAQMLGAGADVYILDYKSELSGLKTILGDEHVKSNPDDIMELLAHLVKKMHERNALMSQKTASEGLIGVSGEKLGLRPIFVIAEELGALSEHFESKERKRLHGYLKEIAMLGRSCLFNLVVITQIPTVESVPAGIKSNTSLKILLGKTTSEMVMQMFSGGQGDLVTRNPGKYKGWYYLSGDTTNPLLFFVPNLHDYDLETPEILLKLYEIGKTRSYNEIG